MKITSLIRHSMRSASQTFPPRLAKIRLARFVSTAALLVGCLSARPQVAAQTINGLTADAQVSSTGGVSTTTDPMLCGFSANTGSCPVFVFQLPTLPAGQGIATASFESYYHGRDGSPTFNGDLYGLPVRASSTVLGTDFYAGALDPNAALIKDNYAPTTLPTSGSKIYCSDATLVAYLNAQYQAGGAGKYVFLRVSPDQVLTNNYTRYKFAAAENPDGSYYRPTISYTTAPLSNNVAMGGGGAVIGIIADPTTSGRFYMRTDIGGAFRWDASNTQWIPITESFSGSHNANDFGIDSLVPDPNNAGTLYVYTGKYSYSDYTCHIYKSTDAGNTWTVKGEPSGLRGGSNEGDHSRCGEKLGVDPNNSNVLFIASYNVGLWKSTDAAGTWTKVMQSGTTPFPTGLSGSGLSFVAFDKSGGTTGGASAIIYVGVVDTTGGTGGVWKTTDGGANWSLMSGGFTHPARATVASDGTLYVTFINNGGVCKASRTTTALTSCAPSATVSYGALAVDPTNAQTLYVSQYAGSFNTATYASTDGGTSWTTVGSAKGVTHAATRDGTQWFGHIAQLAINPFNTKEVWMADWLGVLRTPDITTTTTPWDYLYAGDEETVPLYLCSAPSGVPLLSGVADINGMYHTDVDQYPANSFVRTSTPTNFASTTGLDFCETNTSYWARVDDIVSGGSSGYYSTNDGQTWTAFASSPSGQGGRVAISATNTSNLVRKLESGAVYYTTNGGSSWTQATTAPAMSNAEFDTLKNPLTSNRVTGGTFYLYHNNGTTGEIWRSTDSGATWAILSTVSLGTVSNPTSYKLLALPGNANELWLSVSGVGVFKSVNGGSTFVLQSGFTSAASVAFGAPASGHTNPAVFVWGTFNSVSSYYRADDDGASGNWVDVKNPAVPINDLPELMVADRQTFGRYYVGTNGRGSYVIDSN